MRNSLTRQRPDAAFVVRIIGIVLFAYFFFGFMLLPCLNTLTSIFTTKTPPARQTRGRSSSSSSPAT